MTRDKFKNIKWVLWINLVVGVQNLYYYFNNETILNLLIGAANLVVWINWRHIALGKYKRNKNENN